MKMVVRKHMGWFVIKIGDRFLLAKNGTKQLFLSRKHAELEIERILAAK